MVDLIQGIQEIHDLHQPVGVVAPVAMRESHNFPPVVKQDGTDGILVLEQTRYVVQFHHIPAF